MAFEEAPKDGNNQETEDLVGPVEETPAEVVAEKPLTSEEEKIPPAFIPSSEGEPMSADNADLAPTATTATTIEPMVTAETGEAPVTNVSSAEEIARRVFAAPVEGKGNSGASAAKEVPTGQPQELAIATSNTEDAPVIAPSTAPTTLITEASATVPKPEASAATRAAPSAAAVTPMTETTVSGPSTSRSPKEKDSKVSSWLKTKFSRRASKTIPPTTDQSTSGKPIISEPKDPKVFIGGANLGAPDETTAKTSSDHGESSMREVAMAGKDAGPVDAPIVSPTEPEEPTVTSAAGHHHEDDDSTSISSLSSDEDTRGRSAVRLADTMPGNHQSPIFGSTNATHNRHAAATGATGGDSTIGEPMDPALPTSSGKDGQSSSVGAGTDDFEEARDTFDSERLVPPEKGVVGGESRKSDSPARDSKFVEAL